jgi:hypothetical protein
VTYCETEVVWKIGVERQPLQRVVCSHREQVSEVLTTANRFKGDALVTVPEYLSTSSTSRLKPSHSDERSDGIGFQRTEEVVNAVPVHSCSEHVSNQARPDTERGRKLTGQIGKRGRVGSKDRQG